MTAAYAWCAVIVLCLTMYVVLDGYDLGIGILLLGVRDESEQRELVEVVATAWDGNESWIILLAVALWGGLPVAFGAALPALYLPLVVMLLAIIFRGVAIEMVSSSTGAPARWVRSFVAGSVLAALAQGVAIGGLLSGVRLSGTAFAGRPLDVLTPLSVTTGVATMLVYAVAGAAWLAAKADTVLASRARRVGPALVAVAVPVVVLAGILVGRVPGLLRLGATGRGAAFWALVVVAGGCALVTVAGFRGSRDRLTIGGVVTAEVAGLLALVVATAPVVVPPALTVERAAAPSGSLSFLLVGIGANIPLLLWYSWYAHHVFRGRYQVPARDRPVGMSATAVAIGGPAVRTGSTDGPDHGQGRP